MNESEFKQKLQEELQRELENDKYEVKIGENLIYKVVINGNLKFEPNTPQNPKRGNYAFQTDLLITGRDNRLPLVVIETKYSGFSTHDILTYSTKAQKHREVYPYLRYGFVVGGTNKITNKFFVHNIGFDFAFASEKTDDGSLKELIEIVKQQIKNAEAILDIFRYKNQTKSFNTQIIIKKLNE